MNRFFCALGAVVAFASCKGAFLEDAIAETAREIALIEAGFAQRIEQLDDVQQAELYNRGMPSYTVPFLRGEYNGPVHGGELPAESGAKPLSADLAQRVHAVLAPYFSEEEIDSLALYRVVDPRERHEMRRLAQFAQMPEDVQRIAQALISTREWPAIFTSIYGYTNALCFDEYLCRGLSSEQFDAQVWYMANCIKTEFPFKSFIANNLVNAGVMSRDMSDSYHLKLLKQCALIAARHCEYARVSHAEFMTLMRYTKNLIDTYSETDLDESLKPLYATLVRKHAFFVEQVIPVLEGVLS